MLPSIAVIYGSQTGNAQEIARLVFAELKRALVPPHSDYVNLYSMRQFMDHPKGGLDALPHQSIAIVICSTTGNGDPPDSALPFWRALDRKRDKQWLAQVNYTVLGLGDSNYDNFNAMGKKLNAKFEALGAKPFHRVALADDAVGLEEVVEPWRTDLVVAVKALCDTLFAQPADHDEAKMKAFFAAKKSADQAFLNRRQPSITALFPPPAEADAVSLVVPAVSASLSNLSTASSTVQDASAAAGSGSSSNVISPNRSTPSGASLLVLYASQTGSAEQIAKSLTSKAVAQWPVGTLLGRFVFQGCVVMSMKEYVQRVSEKVT